jgi:hypothetical protein
MFMHLYLQFLLFIIAVCALVFNFWDSDLYFVAMCSLDLNYNPVSVDFKPQKSSISEFYNNTPFAVFF